ncbi:MAG: uroporphyrinogen-III C-methyltransferase [Bacteroidota bacterium]
MAYGTVTLVGAGPGAADLITVRGLRAIQRANIILYDALSGEELLQYASHDAELIYVGKRCGKHSLKQPDINALLVQSALRAEHVVRLKGGDPFVFGRGHEELTYLRERGIHVDLVPGVSSTTSLALLQQVPLTRRHISESFWVLTGTTKHHQLSQDIRTAVKTNATLVILMGMRKLKDICELLKRECKSTTPVMIIENGSRPDERIHLGTVDSITDIHSEAGISGPGIIIIGEVVGLHPEYARQRALQNIAI